MQERAEQYNTRTGSSQSKNQGKVALDNDPIKKLSSKEQKKVKGGGNRDPLEQQLSIEPAMG